MSQAAFPNSNLDKLARWLKVVAEPKRLQILDLIMQGVQCNCELSEALGIGPTLVSHHIKALTQAGLIEVERDTSDARWVYYMINREALNELNRVFSDFFSPDRIQPRRATCGPASQSAVTDQLIRIS